MFGAEAHWTDAAGQDTGSGDPASGRTRRQARLYRVALANKVLKHYGLTLADWDGTYFVLANRTGRSEIVDHLAAVWGDDACVETPKLTASLMMSLPDSACDCRRRSTSRSVIASRGINSSAAN